VNNDLYNFFFLFSFFFLFIGERERERELTSREEREKQTPDEQGTRCRTRSQDPGITTWAEQLSHPAPLFCEFKIIYLTHNYW